MQVAGRWTGRRMLIVATIALIGLDVAAVVRRCSAPAPGAARPQTTTLVSTRTATLVSTQTAIDPWAAPSEEPPTPQPPARRDLHLDSSPLKRSDATARLLVLYNDPAIADNVESITDDAKDELSTLFGLSSRSR